VNTFLRKITFFAVALMINHYRFFLKYKNALVFSKAKNNCLLKKDQHRVGYRASHYKKSCANNQDISSSGFIPFQSSEGMRMVEGRA
jgi:hypothetical protein